MVSAKRKALESMYSGVCTVKVYVSVTDPVTKITSKKEQVLFTDKPCKLSIEKQTTSTNTVGPAIIAQTTKLFIAPELNIPAGSKITVTQNGRTVDYSKSGIPAVYTDHQEITLESFKGYA